MNDNASNDDLTVDPAQEDGHSDQVTSNGAASVAHIPEEVQSAIDRVAKDPESDAAWDEADEAARASQEPDAVAQLYLKILRGKISKELVNSLGQRALDFHNEWYEEPDGAIAVLRRVLEVDPLCEWAFERLSLLFTMTERWEDLLTEYDRALARTEVESHRIELLEEAARIAKDFAGQATRASDYLKQLLALKPEDDFLSQSLERRLEQQERWADLVEVWKVRIRVVPPQDGLALRASVADVFLAKLNNAEQALAEVEELLALEGGAQPGVELLERLALQGDAPRAVRQRALTLLKKAYSAAERGSDVIRLIELGLTIAASAEEQLELHREGISWLTRTGQLEQAIEHGAEILKLAPDSSDVHAELRSLSAQVGAYPRYTRALTDAAVVCSDPELKIEFLVEAANTLLDTVGDQAGATAIYQQILHDKDADKAARLHAARRLQGLLSDPSELTARLEVLQQLAALESDSGNRRACLGEAAQIAEGLRDYDRALALWQERLDAESADPVALDARVSLLAQLERWEALIFDLLLRADQCRSAERRREDLATVAAIQEQRLGLVLDAIATWTRIRKESGNDAESTDALVRLSKAAERWTEVVALLQDAVKVETDDARRATHFCDLGDVFRTTRGAPTDAVTYYCRALEISPVHRGAREGLKALLGDKDAGRVAVEALASAFRTAEEWHSALALLESRLSVAESVQGRQDILWEAAETFETHTEDLASALTCLRRAFALRAEPVVEQKLTQLATRTGAWQLAVAAYEDAIEGCGDLKRRQELLMIQGSLQESKLGALEAALRSYRRVLADSPAHVLAACAAVRVAGRTHHFDALASTYVEFMASAGQVDQDLRLAMEFVAGELDVWPLVLSAVEQAVAVSPVTDDVAHAVHRQLGEWYRDQCGDSAKAESALREAVSFSAVPDTLQALASLQRATPGTPLITTLLTLAEATKEDLDPLYEATQIALNVVGDAELAEPILQRAFRAASIELERLFTEQPGSQLDGRAEEVAAYSLQQLVDLALRSERAPRALNLLRRGASLPFADARQTELTFQAAQVATHHLADAEGAIEFCEAVLERQPDHAPAMALLGDLLSQGGRNQELLALRERELALAPPLERRLVLRLDQGRLLGILGKAAKAQVAVLQANLAESPGHAATVERLEVLLAADGQYSSLFNLLSDQAERLCPPTEGTAQNDAAVQAAALLRRAAEIAEEHLADAPKALAAYERSVALHRTVEVLDALSRIFIAANNQPGAISWLKQRLALTGRSPEERQKRRETVVMLARSLVACGAREEARDTLVEELRGDPAAVEIRSALIELYQQSSQWQLLAPVLAEGVQYAQSSEQQVQYLRDAAEVHRSRLHQLENAIPFLEQAVNVLPTDRDLRLSLADALRSAQRYDKAEQLLSELLEEFGRRRTPERAGVHFQLARIARAKGDLESALAQLDAASSIERSNPGILKLLGDVALQKGEFERAERSYRALLLIIGRQRGKASEGEDIAESAVLYQLHQIAKRMDQTDRAQDLLDSAMEAGARGGSEREQLEAVFSEAAEHDLLLRFLERLVGSAAGAERVSILVSRGRVLEDLGRKPDAFGDYLEAIGLAPSQPSLRAATTHLANELGEIPRLIGHVDGLAAELEAARAQDACDLWMYLGTLAAEAGDYHAAATHLEKAQRTGAQPGPVFDQLSEVLTQLGDAQRTERALATFVDAGDGAVPAEKLTAALYSLAELQLARAESSGQGVGHLERAISRDGDVTRGIRSLKTHLRPTAPDRDAARLLERLATQADDKRARLLAYVALSHLDDVALTELKDAAQLARDIEDAGALGHLLSRAVAVANATTEREEAAWAYSDLAHLREADGKVEDAVDLLKKALNEGVLAAEESALLRRLAKLAHEKLKDLTLAQSSYEKLFEQTPDDLEVWQPLFAVYRSAGKVKKLEEALEITAGLVTDEHLQAALQLERINLMLDTGRGEEAESALREILQASPEDERAGDLLIRVLEDAGRNDELRELLETQYASAKDSEHAELIALYALKLGRLLEEVDANLAIDLYQESLQWCSGSLGVVRAALALYQPGEHDRERADAWEMLIPLEEPGRVEAIALELVNYREATGDSHAAGRALELGFRANPKSSTLRDKVAAWYEAEQNWLHLAELHVLDGHSRNNQRDARAQFLKAAELFYDRMGDAVSAATAVDHARRLDPLDIEVLNTLTNYLTESGQPERAVELVTETLERHSPPPTVEALLYHLRGALLAKSGMGDAALLERSARDLEQSLALGRTDAKADVATVLEHLVVAVAGKDDAKHRAYIVRLAVLLPDLGRLDDAVDYLAGWANAHLDDVEVLAALGRLASSGQHWETAGGTYAQLALLLDGGAQVDAALKMADAWEKAGQPMNAKAVLENVYAAQPGNDVLKARLFRIYEAAGAHYELGMMLLSQAENSSVADEKFRLLCDAGALLLRVDGAAERAMQAFAQAAALRPDDPEITVLLANAKVSLGQVEEASATLQAAMEIHGRRRTPILSNLQQAMAGVARALGNLEDQFQWLESALQSDRQNGAAAAELALLSMTHGRHDQAIKALQLITLLKSTGPMSRAEAYLRQGMIAQERGDSRKAVLLAKRALATEADYQDAKDFLAQIE